MSDKKEKLDLFLERAVKVSQILANTVIVIGGLYAMIAFFV